MNKQNCNVENEIQMFYQNYIDVSIQHFHEFGLCDITDKNTNFLINEIIVLEGWKAFFQLFVGGLTIDRAAF